MSANVSIALPDRPTVRRLRADGHAWASISLCWQEARPVVQLMFSLRFGVSVALAGATALRVGQVPRPMVLAAGAAAWFATTWVVYLVNGVADIETDRRNGSARPLASGQLRVDAAARVCVLLAAVAVLLSSLVSPVLVALVVGMLVLGWLYSMGPRPQKDRLHGFFLVVVLGGLFTYLAGWATVSHAVAGTATLPSIEMCLFALALSLWMGVAGTTKDLGDVVGDRATGRRTLPVLLGDARARLTTSAATVALAAGSAVAVWRLAPALLPVAGTLVVGAVILAVCALSPVGRGDRQRSRRPYRIFMLTQYAAHGIAISLCLT